MSVWYNEIDPAAAHTLRTLIGLGVIAPGVVDERSIKDVHPDDLIGFDQLHFFAGMGGWSVAARLAGWPDDRHLWSASCPCQGESVAGKKLGADDPRHLWPDLFRLIRAARPAVIMGEQVARAAGTHWLDGVCADLGDAGYASRAVDLTAQAVDAPHQRQRLYWVALADADGGGRSGRPEDTQRRSIGRDAFERIDGVALGDASGERRSQAFGESGYGPSPGGKGTANCAERLRRPNGSFYADAEWIICADGKARRAKPGVPMLVDGLAGRTDLWRLAGNGIVLGLAAEVIAALRDDLDADPRRNAGLSVGF